MTHTPGPWEISGPWHSDKRDLDFYRIDGSGKGQAVADIPIAWRGAEANARLIAAAPDLLAALLLAKQAMEHMGNVLNGLDVCLPEDEAATTPAFEAVNAAITKAHGSDVAHTESPPEARPC